MAISLNEIAQQSGAAFDQIRTYPINWSSGIDPYRSGWVLAFGRVHRIF